MRSTGAAIGGAMTGCRLTEDGQAVKNCRTPLPETLEEYIQEMCETHVQELERKGLLPKGKGRADG